nr:hypothetical protein Iba_chr07aCG0350 [Ipomoea batatas]GMD13803.1 hypothetical protein Iba_chr07bCG0280 [Ipomoea batatas]GMD19948.1 hypothetical protein Iba_chr07fCG0170 [Ipomoea batatas]
MINSREKAMTFTLLSQSLWCKRLLGLKRPLNTLMITLWTLAPRGSQSQRK